MSKEKEITNDILGVSKHIKDLIEEVNKAAQGDSDILILGPRGTGKEIVAREIHKRSARKEKPFVAVDSGVIATELIASEMFGHVRGAFTGADRDRIGKVAQAEGGILFLDEIGNLGLEYQGKLLRLLQERNYTRTGENVIKKADIKVIAATNSPNLNSPQNPFRKDLYDRLNQYVIRTPPLKNRYEDVVFYVNHFKKAKIDYPTKALLYSYDYPGNVRELKIFIGKDYDYVKREIRYRLAQELAIYSDTNFTPEKDLFWKPDFEKLTNQKSVAIDSLMATFYFRKNNSDKLEKVIKLYEIVTLWIYSTLDRDDLAKNLSMRREKLNSPGFEDTFEDTYGLTLPTDRNIQSIDIDDDFAGLPQKAMKLYPDFMDFFGLDLDE